MAGSPLTSFPGGLHGSGPRIPLGVAKNQQSAGQSAAEWRCNENLISVVLTLERVSQRPVGYVTRHFAGPLNQVSVQQLQGGGSSLERW